MIQYKCACGSDLSTSLAAPVEMTRETELRNNNSEFCIMNRFICALLVIAAFFVPGILDNVFWRLSALHYTDIVHNGKSYMRY